ncbi:hypothetical protein VDP25_17105 [Winogradskyella sp. ECml5-4]|uniref:hypothetical protein n=1 Tax=Winogradskyella sp. ECml5-4 TaxID=3110975 RepID=UPI002FF039FF
MKIILIIRDIFAIVLISFLTYFFFLYLGKDLLNLGNRQIKFYIELISILLIGIYMYSMHKKNSTVLTAMLITLSVFALTVLTGISGNILNIIFLALIFLFTIVINLFKYNSEKEIEENYKQTQSPVKIKKANDSSKIISELKKEISIKKEFEKSDHNKFMPK